MMQGILEYRLALDAREQHNQDVAKMTPSQVRFWRELIQAGEDEDNDRRRNGSSAAVRSWARDDGS